MTSLSEAVDAIVTRRMSYRDAVGFYQISQRTLERHVAKHRMSGKKWSDDDISRRQVDSPEFELDYEILIDE